MKARQFQPIRCADCSAMITPNSSAQKRCSSCSRDRELAKKREWQNDYRWRNREADLARKRSRPSRSDEARAYASTNRIKADSHDLERITANRTMPKPRNGLPFTDREDALIMRSDLTAKQVAYLVGRSHFSIRGRRYLLRRRAADSIT